MLPEHLRPLLESLGAVTETADTGSTHVHVPGATYSFRFDPDGVIGRTRTDDGSKGEPITSGPLHEAIHRPFLADRLRALRELASGYRHANTPGYHIEVGQTPALHPATGAPHLDRRGRMTIKDANGFGVTSFPFSKDDGPELDSLILSALLGDMPMEALADYVADKRGVSHLLTEHPHQYSRDLDNLLSAHPPETDSRTVVGGVGVVGTPPLPKPPSRAK